MKSRIIFISVLILSLISGCSLIGAEIGEEIDWTAQRDTDDPHKYEADYFVEGLETDIEIVKAIFAQLEKEPLYVVPDPCKEEIVATKKILDSEYKVSKSGLENPVIVRQKDDKQVTLFIDYRIELSE